MWNFEYYYDNNSREDYAGDIQYDHTDWSMITLFNQPWNNKQDHPTIDHTIESP